MTMEQLRPEVAWFAEQMEMALRRNDHKGGWQDDSVKSLTCRVQDETFELFEAVNAGDVQAIVREAADVANFAMMVADNAQSRSG